VTLTENTINQPIFSVRRVTTLVSILDGQTISLGGLIREDVQKVNDKVPVLGDIPLFGRLFRSNVEGNPDVLEVQFNNTTFADNDPEYVTFMDQMLADPDVTWPGAGRRPAFY
jgi:hypothetical protein